MDFSLPESDLKFKESVIQFAHNELEDNLIERDHVGEFSYKNWFKCADFGLLGLSIPKQYGGLDPEPSLLKSTLAMEGFGYACKDNGLALALNAQMWTVQLPLAHFASEEIKTTILPQLASGKKIASHALTEPNAGSDIYSMESTAEKVEGGYVLNGHKHLITLAPIADYFFVFVSTNKKFGKWGISAFLIEKDRSGVEVSEVKDKMGLRTVPIGEVQFKECFVPESSLIGKEGAGFSIMNHSLEYDRSCILASHLGAMQRQLEETIQFVKSRKQFGQSISKFQSVANRIVDMKVRLETSRLLLQKVVWLKTNNQSSTLEAAMLKLHLGEAFVHSSLDAIRNRGGIGYLTENEVERDFRDAVGGILYAGTSDIQRNIIASLLGL